MNMNHFFAMCLSSMHVMGVCAEPFDMTMDRPYQGWPNSLQVYEYPNRLSWKPVKLNKTIKAHKVRDNCPIEQSVYQAQAHQRDESIEQEHKKIRFINRTSQLITANITITNKPDTGYFGIAIPPHNTINVHAKEFFWYALATTGGIRKEKEVSQVKQVKVLNHALPNTLELIAANQAPITIEIPHYAYDIVITEAAGGTIDADVKIKDSARQDAL